MTYLFDRNTIVLNKQEPIFSDSSLDILDELSLILRVTSRHFGQIDRGKFGKIVSLFGGRRGDPWWDFDVSRSWRVEVGILNSHCCSRLGLKSK